ncbi:MAG: uracil-DNA glycosylase family protein [Alsobacter sp.]
MTKSAQHPDITRDWAGPRDDLAALVAAIRQCRICRDAPRGRPLPHEPRPVLRVGEGRAKLVLCGQAPGTKVHASGTPFTDASGDRLRHWLGVTSDEFNDEDRVAIVPMGFCFPGQDPRGADLPPRRECAAAWHARLFALLPAPALLVTLGLPALRWHLARLGRPDLARAGLDRAVRCWREIDREFGVIPLPHPSWRNSGWIRRNPWFEAELVPVLRARVRSIMGAGNGDHA